MKTSVVLPARNEEKLILNTVKNIASHLNKKKYDYEVLVVINGSIDSTERIVRDISKTNRRIKIMKSKPGYGYALRKGLERANGKYVVIFNVDFYDLKLIDLIDIDLYGKDFIIGSKRAHWSEDSRSSLRKLVSLGFNNYLKLFLRFKGSDTHGIKLLKKEVLDKIYRKCKTTSGIFDTELVLRAQYEGFRIADFPVRVTEIRPPRFTNRLLQTPKDILDLTLALKNR